MRTVLVLVLLLFAAPDLVAHAIPVTPITIQSGSLAIEDINDYAARFSLQAPGFFTGGGGPGEGATYHLHPGEHFVAQKGVPADVGGGFTVNSHSCQCIGAVQFMGVTFAEPTFTSSGFFSFSAVIPNPQAGIALTPFSLTGSLIGKNAATGEEVFNLLFDGGGVVQAFLTDPAPFCAPCPRLEVPALRFAFTTVPEPATGLLLAGGLAGLMYFRKRLLREAVNKASLRRLAAKSGNGTVTSTVTVNSPPGGYPCDTHCPWTAARAISRLIGSH